MEYEQHERIAEITLDDGKVNAMGPAFFDDLNALLDRAEREKPGALVLAGREGFYSAGLNIKLLPTLTPEELTRTLQSFGNTLLRVWSFPIPTVAAVTGHAVAGGLFLAFACDRRIMARGAFRLHANEHLIGLPLPSWAQAITESLVGSGAIFTELMLHARPLTPDEALDRRMVDEVVDAGMVISRAREVAEPLAALSQRAYAITKARLRQRGLAWAKPLVPQEMVGLPVAR
jgi:enoyl-CoA hydratase